MSSIKIKFKTTKTNHRWSTSYVPGAGKKKKNLIRDTAIQVTGTGKGYSVFLYLFIYLFIDEVSKLYPLLIKCPTFCAEDTIQMNNKTNEANCSPLFKEWGDNNIFCYA